MKKSLIAFLLMATFALTFTSCKKDKEEDEDNTIVENTWIIDGAKYELLSSAAAAKPKFTDNKLNAVGKSGDQTSALSIEFKSVPTASGSYSIKSLGTELSDNQCIITSIGGAEKLSFSTGRSGDVAKITVSGGKVRVEVSNIEIEIPKDGGATAKGTLSANILEN